MLESVLNALQCGELSLRPYVVMSDESVRALSYSVSCNETGKSCTISAEDEDFRDYLHITYEGDEIQCRRSFENKGNNTLSIKELGIELTGITFGKAPRDDYFYHAENSRIYGTMTLPLDYNRTSEEGKDSSFDIHFSTKWADPGVISERIGASPYQPFPAILLSNYKTNKGLVHGTLSQRVFYHNYLAKHENDTVTLQILSSTKGTHRLEMSAGRVLYDEWYLGATDEAEDIQKIFAKYTKILRKKLPVNYGSTYFNRDNLIWGSWNDGIFRNVSEDLILEEARYLKENFPTVRWIQLDDGYHRYPRDAYGISVPYEGEDGVPKSKFPNGLRHLSDKIREIGLRPAIWIGLKVHDRADLYKEHFPDWFVDYSFRDSSFGILDVSKPEVREYMCYAINTLCREYGFEAVKHDFWSYIFEDSHDMYANRDKSGYEHRTWWLRKIRDAIAPDGYLQTGCDLVMGNPFLGEYISNYRYGDDIGAGKWEYVMNSILWGIPCLATQTGDLLVPNNDAIGLLPGMSSDVEAMFHINYCLVTHTMVEIAGKLSKADPNNPRLKVLKKAACNPNNGQNVYYAGYDYRRGDFSVPEVMYFKTPHFSVVENNEVMPLVTAGMFNVEDEQKEISFTLSQLGLDAGEYLITDVWTGEQYPLTDSFTSVIPPHGSRLLAITKVGGLKLYDANVRVNSAEVCGNTMTLVVDYDYKETELSFSEMPKAITCEGAEIPFTVENGVTKLAVSGKKPIVITF